MSRTALHTWAHLISLLSGCATIPGEAPCPPSVRPACYEAEIDGRVYRWASSEGMEMWRVEVPEGGSVDELLASRDGTLESVGTQAWAPVLGVIDAPFFLALELNDLWEGRIEPWEVVGPAPSAHTMGWHRAYIVRVRPLVFQYVTYPVP